jgi:hypothetical protein
MPYSDKQMCLAALECLRDDAGQHVWVDENQLTALPKSCVLGDTKVQLFRLPATPVGVDRDSNSGCNLFFDEGFYNVVLDTRRPIVPGYGVIPVGDLEATPHFNRDVWGDEDFFARKVKFIIMWVVDPTKALEIFLSDEEVSVPEPIGPAPVFPAINWGVNLESSSTPLPRFPPGYFNPEEAEDVLDATTVSAQFKEVPKETSKASPECCIM